MLSTFLLIPETYLTSLVEIGSVTAEILLTREFVREGIGGGGAVIFMSNQAFIMLS